MSQTAQTPLDLKARYVFPVDGPPLAGGVVTVCAGRIVGVGSRSKGPPPRDLGNVAIIPGLVNAHTHLEFSNLAAPLGEPGITLPDWIRLVIAHRQKGVRTLFSSAKQSVGQSTTTKSPDPFSAVEQGLRECARFGTSVLGEIATPGWREEDFLNAPVDATVFLELIGLSAERIEELEGMADEHTRCCDLQAGWTPGISPHAPYSASLPLVEQIARSSACPVAMHIAESREELQLLRTGQGPFRELLEWLGVWDSRAFSPDSRPMDYLRALVTAGRALVIHGNYLDDCEIQFVGQHAQSMSVVFCPRTHAFFRHERYPLSKMLAVGARVALGTDSRASSPDLNLLAEMRYVAASFPEVEPKEILRMGTKDGAAALGCAEGTGTITQAGPAHLAVVRLPERDAADPHELLLHEAGEVVATVRRGRFTFDATAS